MQQPKYHLQIKPHLFIIVFAKNILAYKPSHTLKNGLKEAVDWLLSLWLLSTRGELVELCRNTEVWYWKNLK